MQIITENQNERVSANQLNKNNVDLTAGQNIEKDPQGSAPTAFQKFAAGGGALATPSGLEIGSQRKKKRGRPRKHPKKNSSNLEPLAALQSDKMTPVSGAPAALPEKPRDPISFAEFTGPFLGMLSQLPAAKLNDKRWALTKDESQELAKALDPAINLFLPDLEKMDPKTAALLSFGIVAASIYHKKALEIESRAPVTQPAPIVTTGDQQNANAGAPL